MDAALVREIRFKARHHYGLPGRTVEENRACFGDQVLPHEHDWRIRVAVVGPIDPETGFVTDVSELDGALGRLVGAWDGNDLNRCIPEVAEGRMQPSTEALARWLYERLEEAIRAPARLARVQVWESAELGALYPS